MPIPITCRCGRELWVRDESAGRREVCPGCRQPFDVPGPSAEPTPTTPPGDAPEVPEVEAAEPVEPAADPTPPPRRRPRAVMVAAAIAACLAVPLAALVAWPRRRPPELSTAPPRPAAWAGSPEPAPKPADAPADPAPVAVEVANEMSAARAEELLRTRRPEWVLAALDRGEAVPEDSPDVLRMRTLLDDVKARFDEAEEASVVREAAHSLEELRKSGIEMGAGAFLTSLIEVSREWDGKPGERQPFAETAARYNTERLASGKSDAEAVAAMREAHRAIHAAEADRLLAQAREAPARRGVRPAIPARGAVPPAGAAGFGARGFGAGWPAGGNRALIGVYLRDAHHRIPVGQAPRLGQSPEGVFIRKGERVILQPVPGQGRPAEWLVTTRDGKVAIVGRAFIEKNIRVGR